ncbi:MAG: hypothetical protein N2053_00620 [Chitinispirillaceae bacterium]|nr:hypothetical protein [Chitinispirillaceae bacterium]
MEAGILLILSSIIVLLQVIILVNQLTNRKLLIEKLGTKGSLIENPSYSQKESESKSIINRNHTSPTSSTIANTSKDDIEKSLRNINLKLKNAERDQEAARRKVQENINTTLVKEKHQNDNFHHGKDRKRDYRNRKHRKDNRNRHFGTSNQEGFHNHQHQEPQTVGVEEKREKEIVTVQNDTSFEELKPVDFNVDNTEHGRKFVVKRRLLKDEMEVTTPQTETGLENVNSISQAIESTTTFEPKEQSKDNIFSGNTSPNISEEEKVNDDKSSQVMVENTGIAVKEQPADREISFGRR